MATRRRREQVRVQDLATCRGTDPDVALHAIRTHGPVRRRVAFDAEIRLPHRGDPQAMLVVVTRGTETTTERARGRITDEVAPVRRRRREVLTTEKPPGRTIAV